MANIDTLKGKITNIADAIREKKQETSKYTLDQMPEAIKTIETGGGIQAPSPIFNFNDTSKGFFKGKSMEVYQLNEDNNALFITSEQSQIPIKLTLHPYMYWEPDKSRYQIFTNQLNFRYKIPSSQEGIFSYYDITNVECIKIQLPASFGSYADANVDAFFGYYTSTLGESVRWMKYNSVFYNNLTLKYIIVDVGKNVDLNSTLWPFSSSTGMLVDGKTEIFYNCKNYEIVQSTLSSRYPNAKIHKYEGVDPI